MFRVLYSLLSRVSLPVVFVFLIVRGIKEPDYRTRRTERFGKVPPGMESGYIWFHAVSAGEALAAIPIIEDVLEHTPNRKVLVTTTTPTGSQAIRAKLGAKVAHCYAPYDIPCCVKSFLKRVRPRALFLIETELWPNLIHYTNKLGAPIYVINARLSQNSYVGYRKLRDLTRSMLNKIHGIACQYEDSLFRFKQLGVVQSRLFFTGSVKFDAVPKNSMSDTQQLTLNRFTAASGSVWIAGSTHPSEELVVLSAHCTLLNNYEQAKLIFVPRHMNRCSDVTALCARLNLRSCTLSSPKEVCDVLILDTMGVLFEAYQYARVAFVGGSLHGVGGHNPIEPAFFGVPVLMGPHRYNFEEICRRFEEQECLLVVTDEKDLASQVGILFRETEQYRRISARLQTVVEQNRGARKQIGSVIEQWLHTSTTGFY